MRNTSYDVRVQNLEANKTNLLRIAQRAMLGITERDIYIGQHE